jgi:hypothetical protein
MTNAMICIRLIDVEDKGKALAAAISHLASGEHDLDVHAVQPGAFGQIPCSPFAYWVSDDVRRLFTSKPKLEQYDRSIRVGLATTSDPVFVRLWTEVSSADIKRSAWIPYAKGGSFSRYYQDVHLVVDWEDDGCRIKARVRQMGDSPSRYVASEDRYLQPGLTYPRRTQGGFNVREMPKGCVFANKGPSIFVVESKEPELLSLLALMNSAPFRFLLSLQMSFGSYEVGVVQRTPIPEAAVSSELLADLARCAWSQKRSLDTADALSHVFILPALLSVMGETVSERANEWNKRMNSVEATVTKVQREIDDIIFALYGLDQTDQVALAATEAIGVVADPDGEDEIDEIPVGPELSDERALTADLIAYSFGTVFGRWDIRYATGDRVTPELREPFAPLPVCSPAMLQGADGLPLSPEVGRGLRAEGRYPLDVAWDGMLVDDPEHPLDLERRVQACLAVLWNDGAHAIEHEACEILGATSLRVWFRKPTGFFADHLSRYSKSRRQAPIYWPLSTDSGNYTLWLYYHRLTDQTLFTAVNEFIDPKLKNDKDNLNALRTKTNRSREDEIELERLNNDSSELDDFRNDLLRIAEFWKPNLNDGVQITAAPLWKFFRLKKWRDTLKKTWDELEGGKYDWAHLALSIWPARVVRAAHKDRSIAIAHRLEDALWHEVEIKKSSKTGRVTVKHEWQPRKLSEKELDAIVAKVKSGEIGTDNAARTEVANG